jgi:hypothetical protein
MRIGALTAATRAVLERDPEERLGQNVRVPNASTNVTNRDPGKASPRR